MIDIMSSIITAGSRPNTEADLVFACGAYDENRYTVKEMKDGDRFWGSGIPFWSMIVLKMLLTHITSPPHLPPCSLLFPCWFFLFFSSFLLQLKLQTLRRKMIFEKYEKLVNWTLTIRYWEWI